MHSKSFSRIWHCEICFLEKQDSYLPLFFLSRSLEFHQHSQECLCDHMSKFTQHQEGHASGLETPSVFNTHVLIGDWQQDGSVQSGQVFKVAKILKLHSYQ